MRRFFTLTQSLLKKPDFIWLGVIAVLASFSRLAYLGTLPFAFHNDEAMNGYVGRFILQNGVDLYGNSWPILYFNNMGDFPNILPMYLSGFFTYIFGVNEFAVRFPIAVAGILTVVLVYVFCRWLFKNRSFAVVAAATLAVMPWHVVLSRATAEGVTASLIYLAGFFLLVLAIDTQKRPLIISAGLLLLSTYLFYPAFRIFTPVSLLPLVWIAYQKKIFKSVLILVILAFGLTAGISQTEWGKGRFNQTSIFYYGDIIKTRSEEYSMGLGPNNILEARIFHNKVLLAVREIGRQYVAYFSPEFWVGDSSKPLRYDVLEHGLGYFIMIMVIAATTLKQLLYPTARQNLKKIFNHNREHYILCIVWIALVAPIPAALTLEDAPNLHRSTILSIVSPIIVATCLAVLFQDFSKNWKKFLLYFYFIVLTIETVYFSHFYINLTTTSAAFARTEEQRTIAQWLSENKHKYSKLYVPGREATAVQYLFYEKNFHLY